MMNDVSHPPPHAGPAAARRRRWLPVLLLIVLAGLAVALGLPGRLSLAALVEHRALVRDWVAGHLVLAMAGFTLLYVAVVALSIPAAAALSLAGGLLFGWKLSAPLTVLAATAGAAIVFEIVKTSFGAALAERAGPMLQKLAQGFSRNGFNLLLFLRLTPLFPFWAVNAVAGLSRMPLSTFLAATAIGIIPGSIAFALVGAGLDAVIDDQALAYSVCAAQNGAANCHVTLSPADFIAPELIWGLSGLGLIALLPLLLRLWRARRT